MAFEIVLIPDTQFLSSSATWITHFQAAADWIVANQAARNIQLVAHLGDVTETASTTEYDRAVVPMETVWDSDIPFAVPIGNHDYDGGETTDARSDTTNWNTYFGTAQYTGRGWWNGTFETAAQTANYFFTLTLGDYDALILVVEFYPRAAILAWAESVIAANPTKRVIVVTHSYLYPWGVLVPDSQPFAGYGLADAAGGVSMWDAFSQYDNVYAVVNGHDLGPPYASTRIRYGAGGQAVFQSYTNWQNIDEGGDGRVVALTFADDWSQVTRTVYNAANAAFEPEYQRTLDLNPEAPAMTAETDIAAISDGGANTAAKVRTALTAVLGRAGGPEAPNPAGTVSKPGFQFTGTISTQATGATPIIRYEPFLVRDAITVDAVLMEVTSAVASSSVRAGIYAADDDWQPTDLLGAGPLTATTSNGVITMTFTAATLPQGNYLVAFHHSAHSVTYRKYGTTSNWVDATLGAAGVAAQFAVTAAYAALPDPGTAWTSVTFLNEAARSMTFLRVIP